MCKEEKDLSYYHKGKGSYYCITCKSKYAKNHYNYLDRRSEGLKGSYGISLEEYNELLLKQNFRCQLCSATKGEVHRKPLYVDHCHETGKIRGLLCNRCNSNLRNKEFHLKALKYLEDADVQN